MPVSIKNSKKEIQLDEVTSTQNVKKIIEKNKVFNVIILNIKRINFTATVGKKEISKGVNFRTSL